jgi:hypothetical protein
MPGPGSAEPFRTLTTFGYFGKDPGDRKSGAKIAAE